MSISFFVFLVALSASAQQDTSFRLIKKVKGDVVAFAADNLENLYLLSSTNQLKKLNANGDSAAIYNDVKKFGQATLIDVSNPLRVLLYYKDFATIVVLDRFLNVRNTIDLRRYNILQAKAIGQSYDNKIWVYDEVGNKLKKIDEDGKLLLETPDFRQLFDPIPLPQRIFDQDQYVYLYDSTLAVYVFDYYGTLKNKIPISGWQNLKVTGPYIFGSDARSLFRYDIRTFRMDEWNKPAEIATARTFSFTASRLYALREDGIDIFSFR
ncbi:MAG: hypothetical protein JNK14_18585 [Chitinophagaceae bacterium]|nr:hypothetical protein [Chitinophagaceae bacterium]